MTLLLFGAARLPSYASTLWTWEYSTSQASASGTFVTLSTPNASGGYLITGITGTRNGQVIDGLQPPGTSIPGNEPYTVDDLIFQGPGTQLTSSGFGFSVSGGTFSNPFFADFLPAPGYLEFFSNPGVGHTELPASFLATPVIIPEPATFTLVLGVFVSILVLRRRNILRPEASVTPES